MIKELLIKYKSFIMYMIFGVLTTVINLIAYFLCFNVLHVSNVVSTIIAWIFAVLFAFVTNKLWVFDSKSFDGKTLIHEILTFFAARLATGILDIIIMYIAVDMMAWNSTVWKLISNIIVIILNYLASKFVIFKNSQVTQ